MNIGFEPNSVGMCAFLAKKIALPTWDAHHTIRKSFHTVFVFLLISCAFFALSFVILFFSHKTIEISLDYTDCGADPVSGKLCPLSFSLSRPVSELTLYIHMKRLYQNHRRYLTSISQKQLFSESTLDCDSADHCYPLGRCQLDPLTNQPPVLCGLVYSSRQNDTFTVAGPGGPIPILDVGLTRASDALYLSPSVAPRDLAWIRVAAGPTFRKPVGRLAGLAAGEYTVTVNSTYPVEGFRGGKSVVLVAPSPFGHKQYPLAAAFGFVAFSFLLFAGILAGALVCRPKSAKYVIIGANRPLAGGQAIAQYAVQETETGQ